jgi:hypothetical protein
MSELPVATSRAGAAPPKSQDDQRVARPGPVVSQHRPSLRDRQRELVRASLIARPPADDTTRLN